MYRTARPPLCCPACPQCRSCLARLFCGWRGTVLSRTLCWALNRDVSAQIRRFPLRPRSFRHPGMERCHVGSDLACRDICFACVPLLCGLAVSREALPLACHVGCRRCSSVGSSSWVTVSLLVTAFSIFAVGRLCPWWALPQLLRRMSLATSRRQLVLSLDPSLVLDARLTCTMSLEEDRYEGIPRWDWACSSFSANKVLPCGFLEVKKFMERLTVHVFWVNMGATLMLLGNLMSDGVFTVLSDEGGSCTVASIEAAHMPHGSSSCMVASTKE